MFDTYLNRCLIPDGDLIVTPATRLLPVRRQGELATLKLSIEKVKLSGGVLVAW